MVTSGGRIIIEKLEIIKFGKFENRIIDISDGLNVIYGENESGKSTIQLFIKAMLYGLPSRKRNGETLKERDRVIPWSGGPAEGILTLSVGGRQMEIRRRFGKTAAADKTEVCDSVSGQIISEYSGGNIGEILLGVPCEVFEKTMWVRQSGAPMSGADEALAKRLTNLSSSGDESVSADAALKSLEKRRREIKAKDGRSAKGRIDVLMERRENCIRDKYDLSTRLDQTEKMRERAAAAKQELEAVAAELANAETEYKKTIEAERAAAARERLRQVEECSKGIDNIRKSDEYIRSRELTENEVARAGKLEDDIKRLKDEDGRGAEDNGAAEKAEKRRVGAAVMTAAGAVAAAAGAVGAAFCLQRYAAAAVCFLVLLAAGVVSIVFGIRTGLDCKNIKRKLENEKKEAELEERERRLKEKELQAELNEIIKKFGVGSAAELARLYAAGLGLTERERSLTEACRSFLGGDSLDDLRAAASAVQPSGGRSAAELDEFIKQRQNRRVELVAEINSLDSRMAYDVKLTRIPADIDTELSTIEEELAQCLSRLSVIEAAEEGIREAAESWNSSVTPQLNRRAEEIIAQLTGGRYTGIRVANDYRMRVETDGGLYDAEYFSRGTYEQMYLALRVAVAEMICKGRLLFIDDALVTYDDTRSRAAVSFFKDYADERQVLLFTCRGSVAEEAAADGADITKLRCDQWVRPSPAS